MRLIDCNEALRKVEQIPFIVNENKAFHEGCRYMQKKVLRIFHESKTIEAEPVKHGRWEIITDDYDCEMMRCTKCRAEFYDGDNDTVDTLHNYCPNCGAKMDLEG